LYTGAAQSTLTFVKYVMPARCDALFGPWELPFGSWTLAFDETGNVNCSVSSGKGY
jgi:hypothetical protein